VNQAGMSSTMTAPNGPSQTLVVQTALMEAKMTHHEVREKERNMMAMMIMMTLMFVKL
jgi:acyl transferase domain-containing protein